MSKKFTQEQRYRIQAFLHCHESLDSEGGLVDEMLEEAFKDVVTSYPWHGVKGKRQSAWLLKAKPSLTIFQE